MSDSKREKKEIDEFTNKVKKDFLDSIKENFLDIELKAIKYNDSLTAISPIHGVMRKIIKRKIKELSSRDSLKKSILAKINIEQIKELSIVLLSEKYNMPFKFKMLSGSVFVKNRKNKEGKILSTRDKNSSRLCILVDNFDFIEKHVKIVNNISEWK